MTDQTETATAHFDRLREVLQQAIVAADQGLRASLGDNPMRAAAFQVELARLRGLSVEFRRAEGVYLRSQLGVSESETKLARATEEASQSAQELASAATVLTALANIARIIGGLAALFR